MKTENNVTLFAGAAPDYSRLGKAAEETEKESGERRTVFAGDFQGNRTLQERIQQRKEKAREEALKIIRDRWDGEKKIDRSMGESREHLRQLKEDRAALNDEMQEIDRQQKELFKAAGTPESSKEAEETAQRQKELEDRREAVGDLLSKNERDTMGENALIRGTKLERLKRAPMVEAQNDAEQALADASEEIIGMVADEAREHLEEEQKEREEQAEKIQEKKEEAEEFREKQDEKAEELEELTENAPVEEMLELDRTRTDVQKEIEDILDKMKLMAEDIKGAMVDTDV